MKIGQKASRFVDFDVKAADDGSGAFWFTASTEDRDRDGDILVASGWRLSHFRKNPVILWAHQYNTLPIGRSLEHVVEDDRLRLKVQFAGADVNPLAPLVRNAVEQKYLRTGSVGFLPYDIQPLSDDDKKQRPEMGNWGKRIKAELMEFSIVPVPANPMALQGRAAKEFGELMVKGFGHLAAPGAAPAAGAEGAEHVLLPFRDASGNVDARLLRASAALVLGARGGVRIADEERRKNFETLRAKALEHGVEFEGLEWRVYGQDELRRIFKDVWHGELLSLRTDAQAEEDVARASAEAEAKAMALAESGLKSTMETAAALTDLAQALRKTKEDSNKC
jgi:hypothetical protein